MGLLRNDRSEGIVKLRILGIAIIVASCQLPTPQPDGALGDAAPATPASVCANLDTIGCVDVASNCASVIANVIDAGLTKVDVACLSHAQTKAAAHACGFVECP